jgi:hypothetical protein
MWDDAEENGSAECWKYQEELPRNYEMNDYGKIRGLEMFPSFTYVKWK